MLFYILIVKDHELHYFDVESRSNTYLKYKIVYWYVDTPTERELGHNVFIFITILFEFLLSSWSLLWRKLFVICYMFEKDNS